MYIAKKCLIAHLYATILEVRVFLKGDIMGNSIIELRKGLETAYIDGSIVSNERYRPQFISNNYKEGKKVLSSIEDELSVCDSFRISVAFITLGGITPLLLTLNELEKKGIKGEILTTNYLNFSEPKALEKLNSLSNITLKIYDSESSGEGFHTKGYIFRNEEVYRIIIGSSNMTGGALKQNYEWNTKIVSTIDGEVSKQIIEEFERLWESPYARDFDGFIEEYKQKYQIIRHQRDIAKKEELVSLEKYRLKPNSMQVGFITNLRKIISAGEKKALLISATGTGKTYASAFAMRELGYKRVLFLVHRGQLARQTKKSYEKVFGKSVTMGLVGAGSSDYDADFVFATVQTLNRDEHLLQYASDHFDAICLDEAHHVPAATYQKVMNHFTPKLWLGMTATPDKRDDNVEGRNVYELFNHQIAYEIRLQQAMEEDLLCPFHYFGITDISIIGDDQNRDFSVLTCDERVKHIVEQANYYGYSGDRIKGLIFCSSIKESETLSEKMNHTINPATGKYYRTIALNGSASESEREDAFERLAMYENEDVSYINDNGPLDYILSVEILNEGVDIVEVNQVIMLRPTQSPIVFIQQLGRGLRKADGKEFTVILDFIGNYNNNFMIPIALSGDRTYNKDNIRRYVMEGGRVIPGASTVHFDMVSKQRIFESIDKSTLRLAMLKEKYELLKDRLGRIPSIIDFYNYGEIDPMLFIEYTKESYHSFLKRIEPYYKILFSKEQEEMLAFVSQFLMNGKRPHELIILKSLLEGSQGVIDNMRFKESLEAVGGTYREEDYDSAMNIISLSWLNSKADKTKYDLVEWIDEEEAKERRLKRAKAYAQALVDKQFEKQLKETIEFGLLRYKDNYKEADENNLVLYRKYSRKDVCRILNWEKDDSSTVYGYRYKYGTCPIFVTYNKNEDISSSTNYPDHFINEQLFNWMTRSRVSLESKETQQIIHANENGEKLFLFIKKSDDEGADFYYMGEVTPVFWQQTSIKNDEGEALPIMNFHLQLKQSVREDLYEYLSK
ncbi:Superfamily II DNA or RNA helicase [Butyrivibrio sp. M55]|nr:Superfamily II DNA or RNA helicase [Butyrivibrio sp. M55]